MDLASRQPWGQAYAPAAGWAWGSNGQLLDNLVVLTVAHRLTEQDGYLQCVLDGLGHLLGRNALGQSYVVGHGVDSTHQIRSRIFGGASDPGSPPAPAGTVAGGPCSRPSPDFPYDERLRGLSPQLCYLDEPTSEVTNDHCVRWQAPLAHYLAHAEGCAH